MDADLGVAPGEFSQGDGVVEIAGGIGIDGDDEVAAKVLTVGGLIGKFDSGEGRCLGDRLGRELSGEVELSDNRENVDAGILASAQTLDEDALRVGMTVFPFGQAGDDLVAGSGGGRTGGAGLGYVEVVLQARIVRDDDEEAGGFLQGANNLVVATLEDADDASARSFLPVPSSAAGQGGTLEAGHDEISVQGGGGVLCVDTEVGSLAFGRGDKGKAAGMELDGAGDQVGRSGRDPAVVAYTGHASLLFEGGEGAADGPRGHAQPSREGGDIEGGGFFSL